MCRRPGSAGSGGTLPWLSSRKTSGKAGPGPLKGQHTRPILRELGYSYAQILDFKQRKVVDWEEE